MAALAQKFFLGFSLLPLCSVWLGTAEVITSSNRLVELLHIEDALLQTVIPSLWEEDGEGEFKKFVKSRLNVRDVMRKWMVETKINSSDSLAEQRPNYLHPNEVYSLIKAYLDRWLEMNGTHPEIEAVLKDKDDNLPTLSDMYGSVKSIIRLQQVYDLSVEDMYLGNYRGFHGPKLSPMDAYRIAKYAFSFGFMNESQQWATLSVDHMNRPQHTVIFDCALPLLHTTSESKIVTCTGWQRAGPLALLGRLHKFNGNDAEARELYQKSEQLDPQHQEVVDLATDIQMLRGLQTIRIFDDFSPALKQLCGRPKNHTLKVTRPYHVCRYKSSLFLPYLRYKEEILSHEPYVSLFHQFIHQPEIDLMKNLSRPELSRAQVNSDVRVSDVRTAQLEWVHDNLDPKVANLSIRIMDATWLDTSGSHPRMFAEPFQVVNYGDGGHYNEHHDVIAVNYGSKTSGMGLRAATMLFYLSDVEIGGQTVFTMAKISVAPVKGMGLFWYNTKPSTMEDMFTLHASCPVVQGEKWIANKWIWTGGNFYRRPCGSNPKSTQLEVEKITFSRRHNIRN